MSVGKSIIDGQHKKILSQLNKVVRAVDSDMSHEEVIAALTYFERYVNEHFAYEEQYMQQRDYLERGEHIKLHKHFREEFDAFLYKLSVRFNSVDTSAEIRRLGELLIEHMKYEDRNYHATHGGKS